jgi:flagellar biosynthesis/type III secretory pathway M-ring protein FliF/YscJ
MFGGVVGGTAAPEDTEPFYLKHLTAIIGVIIAIALIIALGAGFFCFKAKRKMARQRREQQQQQEEQGGYDEGQGVPGSYPEGDDYDEDDDSNGKRYQ